MSDAVVLARTQTDLHALDLHTGRPLWRRQRNVTDSRSLTVTVGGGLVHDVGNEMNAASAATSRHALYGYEVNSGRLRWTTVVQPRAVAADAPIHAAGLLLGTAVTVGRGSSESRTFAYAVDAATGRQLWSRGLGAWEPGLGCGLAHAGGTFYVFSRAAGVLYALDASNGTIRWQTRPRPRADGAGLSVGERTLNAGVPVVAGTTVYVCDQRGVLHAFDVRDGRQRWAFQTDEQPGRVHLAAGPRNEDGLVYFRADSNGNGILYALGAHENAPRWQRRADSSYSGPLLARDMLYVSDGDAATAYDPIDGTVRRRVDLRALGVGGSTELVTDGTCVYALSGTQILALRSGG